ncbi:MAG: glycerol-3-phosphate 1-O-acyltransferase PlsY [Anaerovoracaceae bacterium]|jgi:glycerol-3-phosphate acyltransferase PlsY
MYSFLVVFINYLANGGMPAGMVADTGEGTLLTGLQFAADGSMRGFFALGFVMIAIAYLVGNISPSTIIARAKGIDIKKAGSGNAGTTNATRVLGKKAGAVTLLVDVAKGALIVLAGRLLGGDFLAGAMVVPVLLGHIWPVFFKFQGGKGVATAFGALVMLCPWIGLGDLILVILGVLIGRRMSVGSVVGCVANPILTWIFLPGFFVDGLFMALIVLFKHRSNILRLARGQEPKISLGKSK